MEEDKMKSEYTSLVDLVLSQGVTYSDLIEEIHENILEAYKKAYPKAPIDSTVFVDEKTGEVRLHSDGKDITPTDFANEANQIARLTLIKHLQSPKQVPVHTESIPVTVNQFSTPGKPKGKSTITKFLSLALFWGYNGLYLVFLAIFILGLLNPDLRESLSTTFKNLGAIRSFLFLLLLATPFATIIYALREKLTQQPEKLGKLFFLLEVPLLILIYAPLSLPLNLTPVMWFFTLLLLFIPPALYFYDDIREVSSATKLMVLMSIQQLIGMTAAYLTLLFAFFAPLIIGGIAAELFRGFFVNMNPGGPEMMYSPSFADFIGKLIVFALGSFALLLATGVILIPFLITFLFIRSFWNTRQRLTGFYNESSITGWNIAFGVIVLFITFALSFQPGTHQLLLTLENLGKAATFSEREKLAQIIVPQETQVKEAILDISNASRRFLFTKDDTSLKYGYRDVFQLDETLADFVQQTFLTLAYPFVYQGSSENKTQAAEQFMYVFGYSPFTERPYKPVTAQNVRVVNRTLRATTDDKNPLATVVFEETYENKQWGNQEVVYEFTLPNEAVVTDLKLGPNLEFPGIISPRGAARAVYEQELNRRRDPALLEQIGPRQYRLRVFPIPAKDDMTTLKGKLQKVQFTYVVGLTPQGIPLPVFSKQQNAVLDNKTQKAAFINNQSVPYIPEVTTLKDNNLPVNVCDLKYYQDKVKVGAGEARLVPHPAGACNDTSITLKTLTNKKIALLYDVSNENKKDDFVSILKQLQNSTPVFDKNSFDLYLFNDLLSEPRKLNSDTLNQLKFTYFGKSDVFQALDNFSGNYDAIVIVNGKTLAFDKNITLALTSPLYFVQTGGKIPQYSQSLTAKIIQSGGILADSLSQALLHAALSKELKKADQNTFSVGSYWSLTTTSPFDPSKWEEIEVSPDNPLSYLVSQAYAYQKIAGLTVDPSSNLPFLDELHAFAKKTHIITPYSSLISLVNEQQLQNLEWQEQNYNRFDEESQTQLNFTMPRALNVPSMGLDLFGSGLLQEKSAGIPTIGGGGMGIAAPSVSRSGYGFSLFNLFGGGSIVFLFIAVTAVIFTGGLTVYLISMVRKKKS